MTAREHDPSKNYEEEIFFWDGWILGYGHIPLNIMSMHNSFTLGRKEETALDFLKEGFIREFLKGTQATLKSYGEAHLRLIGDNWERLSGKLTPGPWRRCGRYQPLLLDFIFRSPSSRLQLCLSGPGNCLLQRASWGGFHTNESVWCSGKTWDIKPGDQQVIVPAHTIWPKSSHSLSQVQLPFL